MHTQCDIFIFSRKYVESFKFLPYFLLLLLIKNIVYFFEQFWNDRITRTPMRRKPNAMAMMDIIKSQTSVEIVAILRVLL